MRVKLSKRRAKFSSQEWLHLDPPEIFEAHEWSNSDLKGISLGIRPLWGINSIKSYPLLVLVIRFLVRLFLYF